MNRIWKTGLIGAVILAFGLTGCVDEDPSLAMFGSLVGSATVEVVEDEDGNVQAVSASCDIPAEFDEPRVITRGFVNLGELADTGQQAADGLQSRYGAVQQRPPNLYLFQAVFENRLFDSRTVGAESGGSGGGFQNLELDKNDIIITSATVDFPSGENTFSVGGTSQSFEGLERERLASMYVQSGGGVGTMSVPIINGTRERELLEGFISGMVGDEAMVTMVVDIQLHGHTLNGREVESNTYSFPVEMCVNCEVPTNALCSE